MGTVIALGTAMNVCFFLFTVIKIIIAWRYEREAWLTLREDEVVGIECIMWDYRAILDENRQSEKGHLMKDLTLEVLFSPHVERPMTMLISLNSMNASHVR